MEFPIPGAQHWDVSKQSEEDSQIVQEFIPEAVPLYILDVDEVYDSETSHLDCWKYRHHYRDHYCKVHCPKFFRLHKESCRIQLDRALALMTQSLAGNKDQKPKVYPLIPMVPTNRKSSDTRIFVDGVPTYVMDLIAIGVYGALNIICTYIF